jgi:hypothetical protein
MRSGNREQDYVSLSGVNWVFWPYAIGVVVLGNS